MTYASLVVLDDRTRDFAMRKAAATIRNDIDKWAEVIRKTGMKVAGSIESGLKRRFVRL